MFEVPGDLPLVPLSVASLLSGIVQSLGTKWGLMRHYWVVVKLAITVLATAVLLLYTQTLGDASDTARRTAAKPDLDPLLQSPSPVLHATVALLLLLGATVLAVFKPAGITRYGRRRMQLNQDAERTAPARSR